MTLATSNKESLIKMMSLDSMATSLPPPIAIPISALMRAGASLTPSPTIATKPLCRCLAFVSSTIFFFSSGFTSAMIFSMPTSFAIARALFSLSPVSMMTSIPRFLNSAIACFASSLISSLIAIKAKIILFFAKNRTVLPWLCKFE